MGDEVERDEHVAILNTHIAEQDRHSLKAHDQCPQAAHAGPPEGLAVLQHTVQMQAGVGLEALKKAL